MIYGWAAVKFTLKDTDNIQVIPLLSLTNLAVKGGGKNT